MKAISNPGLKVGGAIALTILLAAAAPPSLFLKAEPGLWEVNRKGTEPAKLCVVNPAIFAQYEHRTSTCSRSIIRDSGVSATVSYTCPGGNFGQSELSLLTPRSIRVETQGIAENAPFRYTFQARRVGNCPSH